MAARGRLYSIIYKNWGWKTFLIFLVFDIYIDVQNIDFIFIFSQFFVFFWYRFTVFFFV